MEIRNYLPEQASMLNEWFAYYSWPKMPERAVGKNAFLVYYDNEPVAFSFFGASDTCVAYLGFTVANPASDRKVRDEALDALLTHVMNEAERQGYTHFMYFSDNEPMVRRMERLGMFITDPKNAWILMKAFGKNDLEFYDE